MGLDHKPTQINLPTPTTTVEMYLAAILAVLQDIDRRQRLVDGGLSAPQVSQKSEETARRKK